MYSHILILVVLFVLKSASLQTISTGCEEEYSRCSADNQPWRHDGICLDGECLVPDTYTLRLLLKVSYSGLAQYEKVTHLHIRGAGPGLSWNRPLPMTNSPYEEDIWTATLDYMVDSNGLPCLNSTFCLQNQAHLEFRVYYADMLGRERDMLGPNFFLALPISQSVQGAFQSRVPEFIFYPWFFSTDITSYSLSLVSHRPTTQYELLLESIILLPASFHENTGKKYPLLLVMYSGREIRQLLRYFSVYEASIEEVVTVLLEYKVKSYAEFLPFKISYEPVCINQPCHTCLRCWDPLRIEPCDDSEFRNELRSEDCVHIANYTGKSHDIISSIEYDLVVELQRVTKNRVLVDFPRERLSIVGFGEGALTAFHAAISRPNMVQNVACISPKFFLPGDSELHMQYGMKDILWREAAKLNGNPGKQLLHKTQKFYFDQGELDNLYYRIADAIRGVDEVVRILKRQFDLEESKNIFQMIIGGGWLDYENKRPPDILSRIRLPLILFFRAAGGPSSDFTRVISIPETSYPERYSLMVQLIPETSSDRKLFSLLGVEANLSLFEVSVEDTNDSVSDICEEPTGEVPWEIFVTIVG